MIAACVLLCLPSSSEVSLQNAAYRLALSARDQRLYATLDDRRSGLRIADGPVVFRTDAKGHDDPGPLPAIDRLSLTREKDKLIVRGVLSGVQLVHTYWLPAKRAVLEESTTLTNPSKKVIDLPDFECGFTRQVADAQGHVLPDLVSDRWVEVPLRRRAEDPSGTYRDYSTEQIITQPGSEPHPNTMQWANHQPSRHRWSEGWAWTHGPYTLGVFKFCQENMLFSVLSTWKTPEGARVRFGGSCQIMKEPAALHRIAPGQTIELGITRYETTRSDCMGAILAYRALLDEKGCCFPADYDPPVHWEQLYDMPDAWNHRATMYTRAIVEREAQKGRDYSCEALYLDPGWDDLFASLRWGKEWLGDQREFVKLLKDKYGLKLSLHTPICSWMSSTVPMGPTAIQTYPQSARIKREPDPAFKVPTSRGGRRNLALASIAKASASSLLPGYAKHQIAHLNDGWYGNDQSWIVNALPAWAEIDLGKVAIVSSVVVGNDHLGQFGDRRATEMRVMAAAQGDWKEVARYEGEGLLKEYIFRFAPVEARKVRVEILKAANPKDMPRLDEIEVYEDQPQPADVLRAFEDSAKRGPVVSELNPAMCQGSKAYLAEAEKRFLKLCADGATFLMFDGNWWPGTCTDPAHGHPVPYTMEDHMRACLDLCRRVHAKYPKVLIEMHDMLAGGSSVRLTPLYYKYGLPGSYDCSWAFELMWNSMGDIQSGAARSLYYYSLGCSVPAYLHVTLAGDNEHCLVLWWFASTVRHLGIGGTSPNPAVVAAEKRAMKRYKALEAYFKRGAFYGISEEVHIHVLKGGAVVNAFNLSDAGRRVGGSIGLKEIGLDPSRNYAASEPWARCEGGKLIVDAEMPAWGAKVLELKEVR